MLCRPTYYYSSTITIAYDAHGTIGGLVVKASGGHFWQGFASGAASSLVSSCIGAACAHSCSVQWQRAAMIAGGALAGGVSSTIVGGNFWEGVCNGLICAGLNHAMHLVVDGGGIPLKRWLKDHANKYKHHWQTDIVNPEGRCKAAMAANIGHYFGSKNGGENYYWGRFKSLYEVDRNVSLEEYFNDCGFDFEIVGRKIRTGCETLFERYFWFLVHYFLKNMYVCKPFLFLKSLI